MNPPAAKPVGFWGGPWRGAQSAGVGAGVKVPTSPQGDPQGGRHQAGVRAGDEGRGRQGLPGGAGCPVRDSQCMGPGWAVASGGDLCHRSVLPLHAAACSLLGAVVLSGHTPACRCRGWCCRSRQRAASPRQEHTDLPGVSPQQAPRHPVRCSRHHQQAWHRHQGQDQLLEDQGDQAGGTPAGAWWVLAVPCPLRWAMQRPVDSPCPVTPIHPVFLVLGGGRCYSEGLSVWPPGVAAAGGDREQGGLCAWGEGWERLGVPQCWGEGRLSEPVAGCPQSPLHPEVGAAALLPSPALGTLLQAFRRAR